MVSGLFFDDTWEDELGEEFKDRSKEDISTVRQTRGNEFVCLGRRVVLWL